MAILTMGFALINVAVYRATRNTRARPRALVRSIDNQPRTRVTDLSLGDSTMVVGFKRTVLTLYYPNATLFS